MAKKKEILVHVDLETLSETVNKKPEKKISVTDEEISIGELLRRTRERKRYHISTISKKLRIKPLYLEALENGHYYVFPGLVYGIGFLRSYAEFLDLDVKEIMEKFHNETSNLKSQPLDMPIPETRNILPSKRTVIKSVLFLVIVYLVWYIAVALMQPTIIEPITIVEPVIAVVEEPVAPTTPVVEEKSIKPAAKDAKEIKEPVKEQPAKDRKPTVYGLPKPAEISFTATEEVWVEVADSDSVVLSTVMYAGDTYNPPKDSSDLTLKTGNAGGLEVSIDGEKSKPLGKKGAVKSGVVLTKKSLKKL